MRLGRDTELEAQVREQGERIKVLEEAMFQLVAIFTRVPALAQWTRTATGDALPKLEPFITRNDLSGHVVKAGVGDQ